MGRVKRIFSKEEKFLTLSCFEILITKKQGIRIEHHLNPLNVQSFAISRMRLHWYFPLAINNIHSPLQLSLPPLC